MHPASDVTDHSREVEHDTGRSVEREDLARQRGFTGKQHRDARLVGHRQEVAELPGESRGLRRRGRRQAHLDSGRQRRNGHLHAVLDLNPQPGELAPTFLDEGGFRAPQAAARFRDRLQRRGGDGQRKIDDHHPATAACLRVGQRARGADHQRRRRFRRPRHPQYGDRFLARHRHRKDQGRQSHHGHHGHKRASACRHHRIPQEKGTAYCNVLTTSRYGLRLLGSATGILNTTRPTSIRSTLPS